MDRISENIDDSQQIIQNNANFSGSERTEFEKKTKLDNQQFISGSGLFGNKSNFNF